MNDAPTLHVLRWRAAAIDLVGTPVPGEFVEMAMSSTDAGALKAFVAGRTWERDADLRIGIARSSDAMRPETRRTMPDAIARWDPHAADLPPPDGRSAPAPTPGEARDALVLGLRASLGRAVADGALPQEQADTLLRLADVAAVRQAHEGIAKRAVRRRRADAGSLIAE